MRASDRRRSPGALPRRPAAPETIAIDGRRHLGAYSAPRKGKTTLLRGLVLALPKGADWVVIDTAQRGDWNGLGVPTTSDPDALGDPDAYPQMVWTPDIDAVNRPAKDESDPWSRGWWYLWNVRGETDPETNVPIAGSTIVVDEPTDGASFKVINLVHRTATQGEGRNLPIWWGTQNVQSVYWRLRGNTLQRFAGVLPTAQDRGILAADWGVELPVLKPGEEAPWGEFYYHAPGRALDGPWPIADLLPAGAARKTLEIAEAQRVSGR